MLFNSLHFSLFFLFVTLLYFSVTKRWQWLALLLASCYFYASFIPAYLGVLGLVILIDYWAAMGIEKAGGTARRALLVASLLANVGILMFFKYYNFFSENLASVFFMVNQTNTIPSLQTLLPGIVLPIGLSFHTFQSMSYTIEVYRGNYPAERHFGVYALYVLFYPQLVAGPIERPQNILPQLHQKHAFDWVRVRSGLMIMGWGMFKKVAIADRLALVVDPAFADVGAATGGTLLVAVFFYAIQIYCDFSGYSDMALGAGKIMGIRMMENFRTPYFAQSITEFWRRWHISLSTWFRDYLYIPLGGNRVPPLRAKANVLLVFGLSGLWHGADWKFVIWGLLHGSYIVLEQIAKPTRHQTNLQPSPPRYSLNGFVSPLSRQAFTFGLVALTWVFFRAHSLADAGVVFEKLFSSRIVQPAQVSVSQAELFLCGLLTGLLLFENYIQTFMHTVRENWTFWVCFPILALLCYLFGVFNSSQFIYFQF